MEPMIPLRTHETHSPAYSTTIGMESLPKYFQLSKFAVLYSHCSSLMLQYIWIRHVQYIWHKYTPWDQPVNIDYILPTNYCFVTIQMMKSHARDHELQTSLFVKRNRRKTCTITSHIFLLLTGMYWANDSSLSHNHRCTNTNTHAHTCIQHTHTYNTHTHTHTHTHARTHAHTHTHTHTCTHTHTHTETIFKAREQERNTNWTVSHVSKEHKYTLREWKTEREGWTVKEERLGGRKRGKVGRQIYSG